MIPHSCRSSDAPGAASSHAADAGLDPADAPPASAAEPIDHGQVGRRNALAFRIWQHASPRGWTSPPARSPTPSGCRPRSSARSARRAAGRAGCAPPAPARSTMEGSATRSASSRETSAAAASSAATERPPLRTPPHVLVAAPWPHGIARDAAAAPHRTSRRAAPAAPHRHGLRADRRTEAAAAPAAPSCEPRRGPGLLCQRSDGEAHLAADFLDPGPAPRHEAHPFCSSGESVVRSPMSTIPPRSRSWAERSQDPRTPIPLVCFARKAQGTVRGCMPR